MHIPKTAGTALKNAFIANRKQPFQILSTHDENILNSDKWILIIRDPWKRFASAYWERRTNPQRKKINAKAPVEYQRGGYMDLTEQETNLFKKYQTPDELCTAIRGDFEWWLDFCRQHYNMWQLFRPLAWYLGDIPTYTSEEHRIHMAIDQNSLDTVMKNHFDIDMPTDPFLARNRAQFDIEQSYECSEQNQDWFVNQLHAVDYDLIAHIKQQSYWTTQ